jgi:hypothetical protein
MKKITLLLLLTVLLVSCDTEKQIGKKVNKYGAENVLGYLQAHRPDLFVTVRDTVRDTVYTKTLRVDTVVNWSTLQEYDTVYLTQERLRIKVTKVRDTLRITGECLGDTIYIEKPCPEKLLPAKDYRSSITKLKSLILPLLLALAIICLWVVLTDRRKD